MTERDDQSEAAGPLDPGDGGERGSSGTQATSSTGQALGLRGKTLGHYRLIEELGHGGQGFVFLAEDTKLNRRVALKVLSRRLDFMDPEIGARVRSRFEREAEAAARLAHPGICSVHEFGEDDGLPWIALQLVEGKSLRRLLSESKSAADVDSDVSELFFDVSSDDPRALEPIAARGRPEDDTASRRPSRPEITAIIRMIEQAAEALHNAHEAGLVHRDIKPGNIMVTPDGRPVILDFGLTADLQAMGPTLTVTGEFIGTPAYMSPEQLAAARIVVDRRSDIYSLGVTLYECLSLDRPFEATSREALYRKIRFETPPRLRALNPTVPRDLAVVVETAMEKNPDRRYQTAEAFAEDLRRIRRLEPIAARPVGAAVRCARWAQRNPVVATLLGTLIVFLVAGILWTSLKNRELARQKSIAEANERTAREETAAKSLALAEKSAALSEYERLADARRLNAARTEADRIWPISPLAIERLLDWKERHASLFDRLPDHRQAIERMRTGARAISAEELREQWSDAIEEIAAIEERLASLEKELADCDHEGQRAYLEIQLSLRRPRLEKLRADILIQRSWDFGEDVDLQFRHDNLMRLVVDLEAAVADDGLVASIEDRLDRSRRIEAETIDAEAAAWAAAAARVAANSEYGGLALRPQLGLVPLGADPQSGFEEFLHWASHDWKTTSRPHRAENGRFELEEGTGIILVLVPARRFTMGAQAADPGAPRYDPDAHEDECPVHNVDLGPFLISKYEMTQGQWLRTGLPNPSVYTKGWYRKDCLPRPSDLCHPLENASWEEATNALTRLGLELPTEAQWECCARAGGDTIYTGTSLLAETGRYANLAGAETAAYFPSRSDEHRDAMLIHARVGSFEPNAWGLYDTTGNVSEWCRDSHAPYSMAPASPDGLRGAATDVKINRGGAYNEPGAFVRVAARYVHAQERKDPSRGFRPAAHLITE